MKEKWLWRVELMRSETKAIIVEASSWEEAGKLAECAHILDDKNFSYVDVGTWGLIEATTIEPVRPTEATKDFDIQTHLVPRGDKLHALKLGNKVITFDEVTKQFGIYHKNDAEVIGIEKKTSQDEAEKATEGKILLRCGRCKQYGHDMKTCRTKMIKPYPVICNDCGWTGDVTLTMLDATCPEGHIHLEKVAV